MGRELELKYRAEEGQFSAIREAFGPFRQITMETTYYDTADRRLSAARVTLRRRYENGTAVYTLKTPLPDGSRGEWECGADSLQQALETLSAQGAPAMPRAEQLHSVCAAAFQRSCCMLQVEGGSIELALDEGILTGSGRELPFREAELELKEGPDSVLTDFAAVFAARFRLEREPLSKFARAKRL